MAGKIRSSAKATPAAAGLGIGLGVSAAVTLAGAAILSYLILGEKVGENGIGYGAMVIQAAASASGGLTAVKLVKRSRLLICGILAAAYYVLLLSMTALIFDGQYTGMGVTAAMVLLGAAAAALPGVLGKGSGKRGKIPSYR